MKTDFFSMQYIEKRSIPIPMVGCWIWTGQQNKNGYGQFRTSAKSKWNMAHQVSYKVFNGEIPENLNVLHHCDNPTCVNPKHLFLGTQKDNVWDMIAKGRKVQVSGWKKFCKKGHELTAENRLGTKKKECRICHNARQNQYYWRRSFLTH